MLMLMLMLMHLYTLDGGGEYQAPRSRKAANSLLI